MKTMVVVLLGCLALTACGGSPSAGSVAGRTLHLYNVNALTGPGAAFGAPAAQGIEVMVNLENQGGGFSDQCGNHYKIATTKFDVGNSKEQAIAGLRQAADDSTVAAIVGPTPSTVFSAMLPATGQFKMPLIATGSAVAVHTWTPYAFRPTITNTVGAPVMLKLLKSKLGMAKVAVIYDIAEDSDKNEAELIRDSANSIGYRVVSFQSYRTGETNFRPQLTVIRDSNPDWIGIYAFDSAPIVLQMNELGMLSKGFFTHVGIFNDPKVWDATRGLVKGGVNWTVGFDLKSKDPAMQKFVSTYISSYKDAPTVYSVYGAQTVQIVLDAVRRACTAIDREKIRDAIANTNMNALGGKVKFNSPRNKPNGENETGSVQITRVTDRGEFEVLGQS